MRFAILAFILSIGVSVLAAPIGFVDSESVEIIQRGQCLSCTNKKNPAAGDLPMGRLRESTRTPPPPAPIPQRTPPDTPQALTSPPRAARPPARIGKTGGQYAGSRSSYPNGASHVRYLGP